MVPQFRRTSWARESRASTMNATARWVATLFVVATLIPALSTAQSEEPQKRTPPPKSDPGAGSGSSKPQAGAGHAAGEGGPTTAGGPTARAPGATATGPATRESYLDLPLLFLRFRLRLPLPVRRLSVLELPVSAVRLSGSGSAAGMRDRGRGDRRIGCRAPGHSSEGSGGLRRWLLCRRSRRFRRRDGTAGADAGASSCRTSRHRLSDADVRREHRGRKNDHVPTSDAAAFLLMARRVVCLLRSCGNSLAAADNSALRWSTGSAGHEWCVSGNKGSEAPEKRKLPAVEKGM